MIYMKNIESQVDSQDRRILSNGNIKWKIRCTILCIALAGGVWWLLKATVVPTLELDLLIISELFLIIYLALTMVDLWGVKKTNEYLKNLSYNFDYQLEFMRYKNIGRNGKARPNKFSKYSEWKDYINKKFTVQKESENFYRFLNQRLRGRLCVSDNRQKRLHDRYESFGFLIATALYQHL